MMTSVDRWTCPTCERSFLLAEHSPDATTGLPEFHLQHAADHAERIVHEPPRGAMAVDVVEP